MKAALEELITRIRIMADANENDYLKDDILYCGKCHTPKRVRIKTGEIMPRTCACRAEYLREAEQQRAREKHKRDVRQSIGSGINIAGCTFDRDDKKNRKISSAMKSYVEYISEPGREKKGLLLYGDVGTGKSFMAACIANELDRRGYITHMTDCGRIIRDMWHETDKRGYIERYNKVELLVLDDLGAEMSTAYQTEQVFHIIDCRCNAGLPTIITTNVPIDEIKKPKDTEKARIYDRVLKMCHPVKMEGQSRRVQSCADDFKKMNERLGL